MPDINIEIVNVTLPTSTGTFDVTVTGFGTPKAVIALTGGIANGSKRVDNGNSGIGFTDGTTQKCIASGAEEAFSTTDDKSAARNSVIVNTTPYFLGIEFEAVFDSWITDGVRFNATAVQQGSTEATTSTIILINGSDVTNVSVGSANFNASATQDVTAPGFEPDVVLCIGQDTVVNTSFKGDNNASVGIGLNSGAQGSVSFFSDDVVTTSDVHSYAGEDKIAVIRDNASTLFSATIGSFDSSGFTLTGSTTRNLDLCYLALKFSADTKIDLTEIDSPTSTGDFSVSGLSGQPFFGLMLQSDATAFDTASGEAISMAAFNATDTQSVSFSSQDAQTTSNATSEYTTTISTLTGGDSNQYEGTVSSLDETGVTFNFTAVDASARKWLLLTLGASAAISSLLGGKLNRKGLIG